MSWKTQNRSLSYTPAPGARRSMIYCNVMKLSGLEALMGFDKEDRNHRNG